MAEQSISFPQLVLIFLVGGLTIRYFFFSSSTSSSSRESNNASNLIAREADVERIQQMFPQLSHRSIMWDLQRNGGNVAATIERVLSGRGLEDPPQSFQPSLPTTSAQSTTESSSQTQLLPTQPDLITRYDLKAKIMDDSKSLDESESFVEQESSENKQKKAQAWSTSKSERQALLQKRREEMILAARRKMEARIAAEAKQVKD